MKDSNKAYFAILVMIIYLVIYIHCATCLWFILCSLDESWVPLKDIPKLSTDLWIQKEVYQYFCSMYYMVLVVGGNETGPSNVMLKFVSTACILIGNLYMAKIMGSLADYASVIGRRDSSF